jgi:nicotinate-nucleotide adenylyltransferase
MDFKVWLEAKEHFYSKCFYFGTFDPIHNDHMRCINAAKGIAGVPVVLVPASESPFKVEKQTASMQDRIAMCRLAGLNTTDVEANLPKPSYTITTLKALIPDFDALETPVPIIMGTDNVVDFHKWQGAEELAKKLVILVCERGDTPAVNPHIPLDVRHLNAGSQGISSTEIRQRIKNGEPIDDLVPPGVAEYIKTRGLYQR